jgi:hypothetical protein
LPCAGAIFTELAQGGTIPSPVPSHQSPSRGSRVLEPRVSSLNVDYFRCVEPVLRRDSATAS